MHVVDAIGRRSVGRRRPGAARSSDSRWRARRRALDAFPALTGAAYDLVARNRGLVSRLMRLYERGQGRRDVLGQEGVTLARVPEQHRLLNRGGAEVLAGAELVACEIERQT